MFLVVAYDIADGKRLYRVAKTLEGLGSRVQYSVFELELGEGHFRGLHAHIADILDPEKDGVKYFRLCEKCLQRVEVHGKGGLPERSAPFVIL